MMMGNLVMFRKDSVLNILSEKHTHWFELCAGAAVDSVLVSSCPVVAVSTVQSLDWETFEQYSTWQLFLAHSIPLETIIPILQHLKYKGELPVLVQNRLREGSVLSPEDV